MVSILESVAVQETNRIFEKAKVMAKATMELDSQLTFPPDYLMKETQWIKPEVQNLILHFNPYVQDEAHNSQINFATEEDIFLTKISKYPWVGDMRTQNTFENKVLKSRSEANVRVASALIQDGFSKIERRRTGENTFLHSLRTFVRGNTELSYIGLSKRPAFYTSLIARLFHDAKEDFTNFQIKKVNTFQYKDKSSFIDKPVNKYKVTFNNQGHSPYYLWLEPSEAKLLEMQVDAVNMPPKIANMKNSDEKAEAQIRHLLKKTEEIRNYREVDIKGNEIFKFGAFEAYQTLRIKLDDRIDNVLTYYATGGKNPKEKLNAKLKETIVFFREVETQARKYFEEYRGDLAKQYGRVIDIPTSDSSESIVAFCYYLLMGGTYEQFFKQSVDYAKQVQRGRTNTEMLEIYSDTFILPFLNPNGYTRSISPGISLD